jgi:hypothetical protein
MIMGAYMYRVTRHQVKLKSYMSNVKYYRIEQAVIDKLQKMDRETLNVFLAQMVRGMDANSIRYLAQCLDIDDEGKEIPSTK